MNGPPAIELKSLSVVRPGGTGLSDISFAVPGGSAVGLLGDSGMGKSLLCSAITGTLIAPADISSGKIVVNGVDVTELSDADATRHRGAIVSYIGPNPHSLLHPMIPVGRQVESILRAHEKMSKAEARRRIVDMLTKVGIPDPSRRYDAYPHELSGGMAQRVVVAMGLICNPSVVIADEPTFGLDVTIQAQVLRLMQDLIRGSEHRSILLSTRDLGVVANFCDSVIVLDNGKITETASTEEFFRNPDSAAGKRLVMAAHGHGKVATNG